MSDAYFRRKLREHVGKILDPPRPHRLNEIYLQRVRRAKEQRTVMALRIDAAANVLHLTMCIADAASAARRTDSPLQKELEPAWQQGLDEAVEMLRVNYQFTDDQIRELFANIPRRRRHK